MKKIRKNYSGAVPNGKVLNSRNNSLQDTYSSDYLNRTIDGLTKLKVSPSEPTTGEEVWLQKGKNLFNIDDVALQWAIWGDDEGSFAEYTNTSGYMSVKAQQEYTFSYEYSSLASEGARSYIFYNSKKEYLYTLTYDSSAKETLMTPTQDGYVRISYDKNCYNIQFELGNKTPYEPYVDKKIYTKNDNGVYEEFYNEESKEVILFKGSTTGDVVLSDNVSNYKYIDIIGEIGGGVSISTRALTTSSRISLIGVEFDNTFAENVGFVISSKELLNEGNTLKVRHAGRMYKYQSDPIINDNNDSIFIRQVIGYR